MRRILFSITLLGLALIALPSPAYAAECPDPGRYAMRLSIGIPFVTIENPPGCHVLLGGVAQYVAGFYKFAVSIGGFIAMTMLIVAGAEYVWAAGRADVIGRAKQRIENAIVGLILLLFAATILTFLNPRLTSFNQYVETPGQEGGDPSLVPNVNPGGTGRGASNAPGITPPVGAGGTGGGSSSAP